MATIKLTTEKKIIKILEEKNVKNLKVTENEKGVAISNDRGHSVRFTFSITTYEHCCGMREIGALDIYFANEITEDLRVDLIVKHLKRLMDNQVENVTQGENHDDSETIGFSVSIPYDQGIYSQFLKAIDRIGFKEVLEFKNKNSGNRLKHFIYKW